MFAGVLLVVACGFVVASAAPIPYSLTELISFADKCDIDVARIPDKPSVPLFAHDTVKKYLNLPGTGAFDVELATFISKVKTDGRLPDDLCAKLAADEDKFSMFKSKFNLDCLLPSENDREAVKTIDLEHVKSLSEAERTTYMEGLMTSFARVLTEKECML